MPFPSLPLYSRVLGRVNSETITQFIFLLWPWTSFIRLLSTLQFLILAPKVILTCHYIQTLSSMSKSSPMTPEDFHQILRFWAICMPYLSRNSRTFWALVGMEWYSQKVHSRGSYVNHKRERALLGKHSFWLHSITLCQSAMRSSCQPCFLASAAIKTRFCSEAVAHAENWEARISYKLPRRSLV